MFSFFFNLECIDDTVDDNEIPLMQKSRILANEAYYAAYAENADRKHWPGLFEKFQICRVLPVTL